MVTFASTRPNEPLTDFQVRRIQRRLEDLERTNATDIPNSSFVVIPGVSSTAPATPAQQQAATLALAAAKKKQTANVRRLLYGKKSLRDWLEELPSSAASTPPYLTAVADPPKTPARRICASCGYFGAYRCPRCGEWSCDRTCIQVHERDGGCGVGS